MDVSLETRSEGDDTLDPAVQAVTELRTAVEQHRTALDTRLSTELRSLTERLDAIDVRTQRPGGGGNGRRDEPGDLQRRAFTGFLRHGPERMQAEEARSLVVSDDARGGYLAPPEFSREVLKQLVEFSPIRQAARVGTTSAGSVILPKRLTTPTAHWVGETELHQETSMTYGQTEVEVHEAACYIDVSLRLLEDAAINVEAEVTSDLAEEFGRLEGEAFVTGNGFKKPLGVMADPTIDFVVSGHATEITVSSLVTLMYSMPSYYRLRGSWLMNGQALAAVRKFTDTSGAFLWQPGLQAGQPETLLGRPVIEAVDMPDVAAGAFPIAFGDFSVAYRVFDKPVLSVLRDPYTMATRSLVRFHARRRVGGAVVMPEAIRKLKIAAS
ncbi:MAG TPA: phage major capsid protein [Geminicoccus sp.]|jgi:HK97 family phage major capsid protein|uniref:phage major capsid protein n=1 Tax=Geminicoccus sp. TaxID=2024832 RepID=UPI002E2F5FC3|nr:phage major capsid protein [Geminicoccus sp.]HEX2527445.1 phage major capsid protein [Geminicoccus sp.]